MHLLCCGSTLTCVCSGNYRKAFTACRKHRVDLNVFVEHNRDAFIQGIPSFLEQVSDVDYLNLFLTSLGCVRDKDALPLMTDRCIQPGFSAARSRLADMR